jgi:hypothetical protein
VEAFQDKLTWLEDAPVTDKPVGTDGALVSGGVVTVTALDVGERYEFAVLSL